MGLTITLAGQDITDFIDEDTIAVESVLGQGAGSGSGVGSDSTATFLSDLGPPKTAIGAGQEVPITYSQAVLADAPHAYYRMDSAVDCRDVSGNGNNGTVMGGVLSLVSGATGDRNLGWEPTGTEYVALPLVLTSNTNVVLEALVHLTTNQAKGCIVMIGDWNSGYGLGVGNGTDWDTPGSNLLLRIGTGYKTVTPNINLPVGKWTHVAAVIAGSSVTYYINSVLSGVTTTSGSFPTGSGYLGTTSNGKHATNMVIDEVACYAGVVSEGRLSAHFGALSASPVLVRHGEVIVKDATGTTIFGGYATSLIDRSLPTVIKTELDCVDYFQYLDRTIVNEVYIGQTDIFIIRDIITKYAPGISLVDIPATGTYTFDKRYVRAKSVKEAIQAVANTTGYAIWITPDKKLEYKAPTEVSTAPFSLSDTPNFVSSFGYDVLNYTFDEDGTINRVNFYGGKRSSDDFSQDLRVQANGSNKVFQLLYWPHDASDGNIHVIKNGVELAVGSPFSTAPNDKLKGDGGTKDVLLNRDAQTLTFDVAPATGLTQLECKYRYATPLVVVVSDKSSFQFYGKWLDGKLDDSAVQDSSTAIQRARVLLAQQSYGLESLEVVTLKGGLQAGMLLHVKNDLRAIDDTYLIQKVSVKPMGAGSFEYTVSLGAWNWNLVDLLFAVAKRAGVEDDATEEDISVVQAQETLEANEVALVINLTTHTSYQYYSGQNTYSGFFTVGP